MITKAEYLQAKRIVDDYHEQLRLEAEDLEKAKAAKQKQREENCGEHYFISTGSKWSPQGEMTCIHCGKRID